MNNPVLRLFQGRAIWTILLLGIAALELAALYFQYELGYGPCVLCVQIRAWLAGLALVAIIALFASGKWLRVGLSIIAGALSGVFFERAKLVLDIERGNVESSCGFDAGFPNWLSLDTWLPAVFEPWESCGYTPMVGLDWTMAEALYALAIAMLIGSALTLIASLLRRD